MTLDFTSAVAELERLVARSRLQNYLPYGHPRTLCPDGDLWRARKAAGDWCEWSNNPWQMKFHALGADFRERQLRCGNREGKTYVCGAEFAMHATGDYPDWWTGYRFTDPAPLMWCCSINAEVSRDVQQKMLLGDPVGTGWIPGDRIDGSLKMRQCGISDVVDTVHIGWSRYRRTSIQFKSYEQGWRKFQGRPVNVAWLDEEPDENNEKERRIWSEVRTRAADCRGILMMSATPLLGETDIVRHFAGGAKGTALVTATWDDCPHLLKEIQDQLLDGYSEHEKDVRTKGLPMLGSGRVFPVDEKAVSIAPFEIPDHFFRISGVDFGFDHPAASVWIAIDRDQDVWYVYDAYRTANETPFYHAHAITTRGDWIPVSWPHDGMKRGRADGLPIKEEYRSSGVRSMLTLSARYKNDHGGAQSLEPIIMEIIQRMRTGRFRVFSNLHEWFEEFRSYHRDDRGNIVQKRDDLMSATFYAAMMQRYGRQRVMAADDYTYDSPMIQ